MTVSTEYMCIKNYWKFPSYKTLQASYTYVLKSRLMKEWTLDLKSYFLIKKKKKR